MISLLRNLYVSRDLSDRVPRLVWQGLKRSKREFGTSYTFVPEI